MRCKQIVFPRPHHCEVRDVELPAPVGDEALVVSNASLVSPGTEMSFYLGTHTNLTTDPPPSKGWGAFPFYPGYSLAGRVERIGPHCGLRIGQRVWLHESHATAHVVCESRTLALPDDVADDDATFLELAAISLNAIHRARMSIGEHVVIVGAGLIGLLACRFAALQGAASVAVIEPDAARRHLAQRCGATHSIDPSTDDCLAAIRAHTDGRGADVVIEASGNPRALLTAMALPRHCGRLVLLGCPHGDVTVNFYQHIQSRSLVLIGAHINSVTEAPQDLVIHRNKQRDYRYLLGLMASGQLETQPLISHRIDPAGATDLYRSLAHDRHQTLGIIMDWTGKASSRSAAPSDAYRAPAHTENRT